MNTAVAEMAENRPAIIEFIQQLVEIAQVIPKNFGRHCGVFPRRPGVLDVRNAACPHPDSRMCQTAFCAAGIVNHLHPNMTLEVFFDFTLRVTRAIARFLASVAAKLHDEPRVALRKKFLARHGLPFALHVFDDVRLNCFKPDGAILANRRGIVASAEKIWIANDEEGAMRRAVH